MSKENIERKYQHEKKLNTMLKKELSEIKDVFIISNDKWIPHVLNLSVGGIKPETMLHALEKHEIYISTQTACSSEKAISKLFLLYQILQNMPNVLLQKLINGVRDKLFMLQVFLSTL